MDTRLYRKYLDTGYGGGVHDDRAELSSQWNEHDQQDGATAQHKAKPVDSDDHRHFYQNFINTEMFRVL